MNHLDLFSGIGGFALAAKWAGINTIQFVEIDGFCQKVLMKNFPDVPIHSDIKSFNCNTQIDFLTGGFPCQPFSLAGNKKGINDDRYLWPEMFRIIKQCQPRWIIAENVPGIISHLDPVLEDLESENYKWEALLIPASTVGAPHKRERLWIIGHSNRFASEQTDKEALAEPCSGKTWSRFTRQFRRDIPTAYWEKVKPPISGVDNGLPFGVDRNKALGNAIVPQIPFLFMKLILLIEGSLSNESM